MENSSHAAQEQQGAGYPQATHQQEEKIDLDDIQGKIFIGGLSWQTTEDNLRFYFEKFGELSDVALMIDKRTGKPRYASVEYFTSTGFRN